MEKKCRYCEKQKEEKELKVVEIRDEVGNRWTGDRFRACEDCRRHMDGRFKYRIVKE